MCDVLNSVMMSKYFLIMSFIVCIQCDSLLTGHRSHNLNEISKSNKNFNHYRRHDMQTNDKVSSSAQWLQFLSDEPIPYSENVYRSHDESHIRRTKFRHRKIVNSDSNNKTNKKHSFRRGQRHRNNKNGN